MGCYDSYITIDRSQVSRSGLYATELPGIDLRLLDALTILEQADYTELYQMLYNRAWTNMVSDVSKKLQGKFLVDSKLVSRETGQFESVINDSTGPAGVQIYFDLPRYARIHIISVSVYSEDVYLSPDFTVSFQDTDASGEVLKEISQQLAVGRGTINVDSDFEVDTLFISFDPTNYTLRKTETKRYNTGFSYYDKLECSMPCWDGFNDGYIKQINGGGLNVKYNVVCSIEKFICENINLFKTAFWWRIGLETVVERRHGNKLNEFTTMSTEDIEKLQSFYNVQYMQEVDNAIDPQSINEDPICFSCRQTIYKKTIIS